MDGKKISVIMGIYNCADTLVEALDCILKQTYSNWEVIMCDDCSSDLTYEVAMQYVDKYPEKFVLLRNEQNQGLNYTLNKCLKIASGEYIARMDGDDRCALDRFEKELKVLESTPDVAIVSSDMDFFDEEGVWGRTHVNAVPSKMNFVKSTPFCHAACMVKKEAYLSVNGYSVSDRLLRVEDYHLWIKMYEKGFRGVNIQEILYSMRDDRNAQGRRKFKYRINEAYVKAYAINHLNLPCYCFLYCIKPILVGLMPSFIYKKFHRSRNS